MPRRGSPYGPAYERERARVLYGSPPCVYCGEPATETDHTPPLARHVHVQGSGCCRLVPSCSECQRKQAGLIRHGRPVPVPGEDDPGRSEVEPVGFEADHAVWDVDWLDDLRDVPDGAVWPRLMTVPHPDAVGTLADEFVPWAEARMGRRFRWWQRLVSVRLLEVDADGRLLWETLILTLARQLGKSWWLRELLLWRIHQGDRFGEPQDVVHTGKDLAICKDVQRPCRFWAKARNDLYHVREVNGQEEIEYRADGSRWMLRAKEAVYGLSASLGAADEAWKVRASSIEEGLTPTMVEREQAQLVLVSTAHRLATALMLGRRASALERLDNPTDGDLLIEWSAPRVLELDDRDGWRLASPHWSARRERLITKRLTAALSGESDDPDEPDPLESFRSQWLNQWPTRVTRADKGELLVHGGAWDSLYDGGTAATGGLFLAVDDWYGQGAAVCAVGRDHAGRLVVSGETFERRIEAFDWVRARAVDAPGSMLVVGAVLEGDPSAPDLAAETVGNAELRSGLALLRELVAAGQVVHDGTVSGAVEGVRVIPGPSGLALVPGGRYDLTRAVCWALHTAQTAPVPMIY